MYCLVPTRGPFKGETVYYARIRLNGRYRHVQLGVFSCKTKAGEKLNQVLVEPTGALEFRRRREAVTFGEVLDRFLEGYRSRNGTTDYYRSVLKPARKYFDQAAPSDIRATAIDDYLDSRRAERTKGIARKIEGEIVMVGAGRARVGESTLRKECIALGTACKWAVQRDLLKVNPFRDYSKPKEPRQNNIAILAADQEPALRAEVELETRVPLLDVWEWALYSGMRREEIVCLRWSDVDRAQGLVHVAPGKTGKGRSFPLGLSVRLADVLERRQAGPESPLVFCDAQGRPLGMDALNGALERAERRAGVPKAERCLWNRYRHTWATRLAATGRVSIFEVAKWMGNSAAICERHYAKYLPGAHDRVVGVLDGTPSKSAPPAAPRVQRRLQLVK
jgi:integrase